MTGGPVSVDRLDHYGTSARLLDFARSRIMDQREQGEPGGPMCIAPSRLCPGLGTRADSRSTRCPLMTLLRMRRTRPSPVTGPRGRCRASTPPLRLRRP